MRKEANCILLFCLFIMSCGRPTKLSPSAYVKYLSDPSNNIRKTITMGTRSYDIQMATPEFVCCNEFADRMSNLSVNAFNKRLDELQEKVFFIVRISEISKGPSSVSEDMRRKGDAEAQAFYFDQHAAADISLLTAEGEKHPISYLYENNYGAAPYNTIVVGFRDSGKRDISFVFNDRYHHNPFIKAAFSKASINNIPRLSLNDL